MSATLSMASILCCPVTLSGKHEEYVALKGGIVHARDVGFFTRLFRGGLPYFSVSFDPHEVTFQGTMNNQGCVIRYCYRLVICVDNRNIAQYIRFFHQNQRRDFVNCGLLSQLLSGIVADAVAKNLSYVNVLAAAASRTPVYSTPRLNTIRQAASRFGLYILHDELTLSMA